MMLGRKQSLKGEPVLADYGPEESLNESADIEWVNKVSEATSKNENYKSTIFWEILLPISVVGKEIDATLCSGLVSFRLPEHPENLRESAVPPIRYLHLRFDSYVFVHRWNDRQDAHTRNIKGKTYLHSRIYIMCGCFGFKSIER